MAHTHSLYDTDAHFKIDPITRRIKEDTNLRTLLVQRDHNCERFTFELPRYIEGHDMSLCDIVRIHYENGSNDGVYEVDDYQLSPESDDVVIFSWLISNNATQNIGNLIFGIELACTSDGEEVYSYHIIPFEKVTVSKSMIKSQTVVEEYPDILTKWKLEFREYIDDKLGVIENGTY